MTKRKPIIAGNWKMHKTISESVETALDLKSHTYNSNHCEIVIAPPFTAIKTVADRLEGSHIKISGQNVAAEGLQGAFTGEVSASMLIDAGCKYVIIGHSERRQYYGETSDYISKKLKIALSVGLTPILCIGEVAEQRTAGKYKEVVTKQILESTSNLTASEVTRIVAAYEPVWAIGTGQAATPEIAQEMHSIIRYVIEDKFNIETSGQLRILYGGSVNSENIVQFMEQPDIDGALVGGASLNAEMFSKIIYYNKS